MWCEHCDDIEYCTEYCPYDDCIMSDMECVKAEKLLQERWKEEREAAADAGKIYAENNKKWCSAYYAEHREERLAYQREYTRTHKREQAKAKHDARWKDIDATRAKERERYDRNKEHIQELARARRAANKEKVQAYQRAYYAANKERINRLAKERKERRRDERRQNEQSGCAELSAV